jgi:hypothetical protein
MPRQVERLSSAKVKHAKDCTRTAVASIFN